MDVKISIIIPVYNVEDYLKECLDSLLRQTFTEFEIICIDDGSSDNSLDILKKYQLLDTRIMILNQQHQFAGTARNKGISCAKGEYLLFLDADDFFEKDMLEKIYEQGKKTQAQIILFDARKYHQLTKEYDEVTYYLRNEILKDKEIFNRHDFPDDILTLSNPAPWTKCFLKKFILEEKLLFQNLANTNDAYFTISAMAIADRITWIDTKLVNYRIGLLQNTQSHKEKNPLCFIDAYRAIYDELNKRGIYHEVERSFVKVALSSTVYCMNSIHDEKVKKEIIYALQDNKFSDMNLLNYPEDFYLNKRDYNSVRGYNCIYKEYQIMEKNKQICDEYEVTIKADLHQQPFVSVIIPIYDVEKYLPACLESIVNQSLKNIEIICVIDGSPDHCQKIVESYATYDDRITMLVQRNMGLSASRNHGFKEAKGEYVYFMDSDDILDYNALKELYDFSMKENLDSVYFDASCFADDFKLNEKILDQYHRKFSYPKVCMGIELFRKMNENDEYRVSACLQFNKRQHILNQHVLFHEGVLHEDNAFTTINLITAKKVGYIHKDYFHRRYRENSIMTKKENFQNVYGYYIAFKDVYQFIQDLDWIYISENQIIFDWLLRILTNARDIFARLDDAEKSSYLGLDFTEKNDFRILVSTPGYVKSELIFKQQRLQQTFDEKYERGLIIKELRTENKQLKKSINRLKPSTWIKYIKRHIRIK